MYEGRKLRELSSAPLEPDVEVDGCVYSEGGTVEDSDGRQDGDGDGVLVVVARDQLLTLVDVDLLAEAGGLLVSVVNHRLENKKEIYIE